MSGFGDGTGWSSERGETPGYSGSGGNAGSGSSGKGASGNGSVTRINNNIGDEAARRQRINPKNFSGYILTTDGEIMGITANGIDLGDAYGVNLGYPVGSTATAGGGRVNAPGGTVSYNVDISDAKVVSLHKIISDNALWANMTASGTRITNARQKTENAKAELALINDTRKKQPEASVLKEAARFVFDFHKIVFDRFGIKAKKISEEFAAEVKGKKIRNVKDATSAYSRHMLAYSNSDRRAMANALRSVEYTELARNMQRFSTALGYYGKIADIGDMILEIIRATETKNWQPVIVKLETLAAGKVATVVTAFAFSLIFSTPLGIVGYAIIMGLVGAMVNDELVKKVNAQIGFGNK